MSNASIEVIGESVVDCVERRDGTVTTHPGGSAANVAFGLARLGREVDFLTQLGADSHGGLMRRHLEGAGVRLRSPGDVAARTPSARAQLDASGAAHYYLDVDWRLPLDTAAVGHGHLHLGAFPAFLGSAPADVEAVLAKAHSAATTSFDPNIRPALLPAQHLVRERLEAMLAWIDVVKASDEDLAWLYPGLEPADVIARWLTLGPSLAVATLGSEGSIAATHAERLAIRPMRVEVVDTVGAGDAYMSALLDGLARVDLIGVARREALQTATAATLRAVVERAACAAALTVMRAGASPPSAQELLLSESAVSLRSGAPIRW